MSVFYATIKHRIVDNLIEHLTCLGCCRNMIACQQNFQLNVKLDGDFRMIICSVEQHWI